MNNILEGNWKQMMGEIKKKWAQLTDDDLKKIDGQKDKLLGTLQEKYGWAKERAEEEITRFFEDNKENTKDMGKKASKALEGVCCEVSKYVTESPMKAVAMAVGAGILISWLLRR